MAPLALAGAAVTARPWTCGEVIRARKREAAGMSHADIALGLGRTERAVRAKLFKERGGARPKPGPAPMPHAAQQAREALAWEVAVARAERATAPLLRSWPSGLWP